MNRTHCLDVSDAAVLQEYERAFYAAFQRVTGNRLIRDLWSWDDAEGRLATRVPYEDQLIVAQRDEAGRMDTAIATNMALREFQSSAFGFSPPSEPRGCCEFLTFFSVGNWRLTAKLRFWAACFAELRARGYHTGYATTAQRGLPIYRRIGGEVIGETEISGEKRYFLRYSLERTTMRGAQRFG